jgi:hypothetical protein
MPKKSSVVTQGLPGTSLGHFMNVIFGHVKLLNFDISADAGNASHEATASAPISPGLGFCPRAMV